MTQGSTSTLARVEYVEVAGGFDEDEFSLDLRATGALFGTSGPLAFATSWAVAFDQAGHALSAAASEGVLEHGTRDILRHHVIFHWNRIGLPSKTQSILAHAAQTAIFS